MLVRPYDECDYETVKSWWIARGHAVLAPEALPDGFVVEFQDEPVLASWFFDAGTTIALLDWTVSKPDTAPNTVSDALVGLIAHVEAFALSKGITALFAISGSRGLTNHMLRLGYVADIKPHTVLFKSIGGSDGSC